METMHEESLRLAMETDRQMSMEGGGVTYGGYAEMENGGSVKNEDEDDYDD